jgi:hypothetical protein
MATAVFLGSLISVWLCHHQMKNLEERGFKKQVARTAPI